MMNLSSDEDEDLSIPEQSESIPVAMPSGKPSRYRRYKIAETPMQLVDESVAVGAPSQPSDAVSNDSVANVHPRPEFDEILNDVTKQSMWSCFHDTFASFRDPLIDPESIMHPSRLYSFQIKALRRIQKALLGTLTPQEFEETKRTYRNGKPDRGSNMPDCSSDAEELSCAHAMWIRKDGNLHMVSSLVF